MSKLLTVDRGNTAAKICVFDNYDCLESVISDSLSIESVVPLLERHSVDGAAYCCVGRNDVRFIESLRLMLEAPLLLLTHSVELPFKVDYTASLGLDRIAAAAGALALYRRPTLIADAGTALTLDLVADNGFRGGNISPGMVLRFKALNDFTNDLPLVGYDGTSRLLGHDTESAIRAGVVNGIVAEISSTFAALKTEYPDLLLVLSGGDADILARNINETEMVVDHDIVGRGLVKIFNYNFSD